MKRQQRQGARLRNGRLALIEDQPIELLFRGGGSDPPGIESVAVMPGGLPSVRIPRGDGLCGPFRGPPSVALGVTELLTARTALSAGVSPPVQADIVPSSVSKMNEAGSFVPGTRNAVLTFVVGFHTMPLGAAVCGQLEPCPAVGGQGIVTTRGTVVPSPS